MRRARPAIFRSVVAVVFLSFLFQRFTAGAALCSKAEGSPCQTVRYTVQRVLQVLHRSASPTRKQRQERLWRVWYVILPHIDTCEMALRSLPADYLPHMTNPQKEEFTDIYSRLLMQEYSLTLDRYTKNTRFRVVYDEEHIEGIHARVVSRLITTQKQYGIAYRLHREREKWLIYDISFDVVSQVENYRAQFDRIGKKLSYDYERLGKRIKDRLKPELRYLPIPQVKMRLWGICERS